ncbi:hypothetical protein F4808DRAFT_246517 [Astrocystis sublimbata]|nr:hypothetical protein F4808DRAFT_246517 [Astrocystis sublimbata]
MPSRLHLPKLSLFSSSKNSSTSSSSTTTSISNPKLPQLPPTPPPASMSPRFPIVGGPVGGAVGGGGVIGGSHPSPSPSSPPARLHLRSFLPSSPEEAPIMPPPPRTPRAWVWQCHHCRSIYRLGCTRRCLDCSHTYCVVSASAHTAHNSSSSTNSASNTHSSSSSTQSNSNSSTPPSPSRGKKRRRGASLCGAEFDYVGWVQWGSWKRKVLGYESTGRCDSSVRDAAFLERRHDCFVDCDSPSECGHRRFQIANEMLRKRMFDDEVEQKEKERMEVGMEERGPPSPGISPAGNVLKSPDDDEVAFVDALGLPVPAGERFPYGLGEGLGLDGDLGLGLGLGGEMGVENPLKSPLQTSFLLDDDDDDDDEDDEYDEDEDYDDWDEEERDEDGRDEKERREEESWWDARSSIEMERDWATTGDSIDHLYDFDDDEDGGDDDDGGGGGGGAGGVEVLKMRNVTAVDVSVGGSNSGSGSGSRSGASSEAAEDSDSGSESDGSGWSSIYDYLPKVWK